MHKTDALFRADLPISSSDGRESTLPDASVVGGADTVHARKTIKASKGKSKHHRSSSSKRVPTDDTQPTAAPRDTKTRNFHHRAVDISEASRLPAGPLTSDGVFARESQRGMISTPRTDALVMDPLTVLRQCIRHFAAHPEHYGTNIQALLTREVTYVSRMNASEAALAEDGLVGGFPLATGGKSFTNVTTDTVTSAQRSHPLQLPPLPSNPMHLHGGGGAASWGAASSARAWQRTNTNAIAPSTPVLTARVPATTSSFLRSSQPPPDRAQHAATLILQEPTPGLVELMARARETKGEREGTQAQGGPDAAHLMQPSLAGANALSDVPEVIQWGTTFERGPHTPPPRTSEAATRESPTLFSASTPATPLDALQPAVPTTDSKDAALAYDAGALNPSAQVTSLALAVPSDVNFPPQSIDGHRVVVLDANGYEVSFLQGQLQQVEAAYNAKCVRLYELVEENRRLLSQLAASDEAAATWRQQFSDAQSQLEATRRELEAWRDRATDLGAPNGGSTISNGGAGTGGGTLAGRRASLIRRAQANQMNEVKQEVVKLTQLWRETERALQESRRAFENAEREATQSHDHLSDAFQYIERLERRVARRDAYLTLVAKRQASLEEKYEKLMWCFQELGSLAGAYSYADFLLSDEPVWTLALLVRLQRHVGLFSPVEAPTPPMALLTVSSSSSAVVLPGGGALSVGAVTGSESKPPAVPLELITYTATPGGAKLVDGGYDTLTVYRTMANEATAVDERRGKAKRLRTNLHGTVGCRVVRWQNHFSLDFLGGEDSFPDSCDLNKRKQPLLTLGSLVLPWRKPDGAEVEASPQPAESANSEGNSCTPSTTFPRIAKTLEYSQATLRFLLRSFWARRLAQYRQNMYVRVQDSILARRRQARRDAKRARSASALLDDRPIGDISEAALNNLGDADDSEEEGVPTDYSAGFEEGRFGSTFLGALVEFVLRHTDAQGGVSTKKAEKRRATGAGTQAADREWLEALFASEGLSTRSHTPLAPTPSPPPRYIVRGVAPRPGSLDSKSASTGDKEVWDNGRVFFASVLDPEEAPHTNEPVPITERSTLSIPAKARELLCALYFMTMECKDTDADFRLFYLVSHQLIPEMAAVNFFASLEAFEKECYGELRRALHTPITSLAESAATKKQPAKAASTRADETKRSHSDVSTGGNHADAGKSEGHDDDASPSAGDNETASPFANFRFGAAEKALEDISGIPFSDDADKDSRAPNYSIQQDSAALSVRRLSASTHTRRPSPKTRTKVSKSPMDLLCRVVELVDRAALAGEDERVEEDSDGEGYGSILPGGGTSANIVKTAPGRGRRSGGDVGRGASRNPSAPPRGRGGGDRGNLAGRRYGAGLSGPDSRLGSAATGASSIMGGPHEVGYSPGSTLSAGLPSGRAAVSQGASRPETAGSTINGVAPSVLVHNIREYLAKLKEQREAARAGDEEATTVGKTAVDVHRSSLDSRRGSGVLGKRDSRSFILDGHDTDGELEADMDGSHYVPSRWERVDECVRAALAPHTSLLRAYTSSMASVARSHSETEQRSRHPSLSGACGETEFFAEQRAGRWRFHDGQSKSLAATRGLLPLDTVLAILTRHLFTTYAVSCCGTPRFSLADTLMPFGSSDTWEDYVKPLSPVGQLPPTEVHLKRLRFALALDTPASLVRFKDLFTFDAHTANPTHLYDEMLTLWLDICQQQQCFCMDVVQRACASRHERFMSEGAEDCDGNIPISFLRKGVRGAFEELGFGCSEADAFVGHLVNYARLLREEDDVQFEQFTDGPFFINSHDLPSQETAPHLSLSARTNEAARSVKGAEASGRPSAAPPPGSPSDGGWDFSDEAESCSLLHIGLAIRMLYVVWGFDAAGATRRLSETLASIPLHQPFAMYRTQHHQNARSVALKLSATGTSPSQATGAPTSIVNPLARKAVHSLVVEDDRVRLALVASNFEEQVRAAYTAAVKQMSFASQDSAGSLNFSSIVHFFTEGPHTPFHGNPLRRSVLHYLRDLESAGAITIVGAATPAASAAGGVVSGTRNMYPTVLPLVALPEQPLSSEARGTHGKAAPPMKNASGKSARKVGGTRPPSEARVSIGDAGTEKQPSARHQKTTSGRAGQTSVGGGREESTSDDGDRAPLHVLAELREPPPDSGLYSLSRLLGLAGSAVTNGSVGSEGRDNSKATNKKVNRRSVASNAGNASANATAVSSADTTDFASLATRNLASTVHVLSRCTQQLMKPINAIVEAETRAARGAFATDGTGVPAADTAVNAGRRRGKSVVAVTEDPSDQASPVLESDTRRNSTATAAEPQGKRSASFVASVDVELKDDHGTGRKAEPSATSQRDARGRSPMSVNGTAATATGASLSAGLVTPGASQAYPYAFSLDWLPNPAGRTHDVPASAAGMKAPPTAAAPSLLKSSNVGPGGKDPSATLHVGLLHGACAALSLM